MKAAAAIALAAVALALGFGAPAIARERVHYIAAVEVVWNYAPLHMNPIAGTPLPRLKPTQIGWTYHKAMYREYTDATFTTLARTSPADRYLGMTGPVIRAEVGDTVVVVFRNRTRFPVDIAPGGVPSSPRPSAVKTGGTRTYRWSVGDAEGPSKGDGSSILYAYESDVDQPGDENLGLIGPLIVTRRGQARADGSPVDVDREIIALFSIQMESHSLFLPANLADPVLNPRHPDPHARSFEENNAIPSINGYTWGNAPMPTMRAGEHVRWYFLSTSNSFDGHIPTFEGQTLVAQGNRTDAVTLVTPHVVADMVPDNPGVWLLVCTLNVHLGSGMEARYRVLPR
jgi:FtsP/CotA-like multicopper oxidase with cupredoxin domain